MKTGREPYGCNNRKSFQSTVWVQEGWLDDYAGRSRVPLMQSIPFRMERDCQYTKTSLGREDPRCHNCKHRIAD